MGCEWWAVLKGAVSAKGVVHCEWNSRDERSDPVGTAHLELTAGWHRKMVKFGHKPQGCVHELG